MANLLKCDTLICEEKGIFDACIAWGKAACERKGENPLVPENIRAQLKDTIYQIRFNSMTKEEAADCIFSFRRLFTNEELEEIISMIGRKTEFQSKKFNWATRNLRFQRKNQPELECSRMAFFNNYIDIINIKSHRLRYSHQFNSVEQTTFTSNKMLMLNGFICEGIQYQNVREYNPVERMQYSVNVKISKINLNDDNDIDEIFSQQMTLNFTEIRESVGYHSKKAHVKLEPAVFIRPQFKYKIEIQFPAGPRIVNHCALKQRVRVDHSIVIQFNGERGAITSLDISRIDEESYIKKILQNPKVYLIGISVGFLYWALQS